MVHRKYTKIKKSKTSLSSSLKPSKKKKIRYKKQYAVINPEIPEANSKIIKFEEKFFRFEAKKNTDDYYRCENARKQLIKCPSKIKYDDTLHLFYLMKDQSYSCVESYKKPNPAKFQNIKREINEIISETTNSNPVKNYGEEPIENLRNYFMKIIKKADRL